MRGPGLRSRVCRRLSSVGLAGAGRLLSTVVSLLALVACAGGPPAPSPLDTRHDTCRHCRMAVSNPRFAAQLVAPGEEPQFFDDIGCLAAHLGQAGEIARGMVAFVADHRTKAWVRATAAVYTKVERLETPMGSHLIAHADAASRSADPDAGGGTPVTMADVFGRTDIPDGSQTRSRQP